jgi:hypothetical protein
MKTFFLVNEITIAVLIVLSAASWTSSLDTFMGAVILTYFGIICEVARRQVTA